MRKMLILSGLLAASWMLVLSGCAEGDGTQEASASPESRETTAEPAGAPVALENLCFISAGDLNGDGLEDYAISVSPQFGAFGTQRDARIIFGDGTALQKEDFVHGAGDKYPSFSLSGALAAPFLCGPYGSPLKKNGELVAVQRKAPAEKPLASAMGISNPGQNPLEGPPRYQMIDLSVLSPGKYCNAYGIGPTGKAVGNFLTRVQGGNYQEHAFLYEADALLDLGTLGGHYSIAHDLNGSDQVVGYSLTGETDEMGFVNAAFVWDGVAMRDLGIDQAAAYKINEAGQVVGERSSGSSIVAFMHDNGTTTDLGSLDGRGSWALSINNRGQIVGNSSAMIPGTEFRSTRGFLFQNGSLTDLGSFGAYCYTIEGLLECYEYSSATDINDRGMIVGYSNLPDSFHSHAFRMTGQGMEDLGTLGGTQSWAQAVNESGQIVGSSLNADDSAYHAFLFDQGQLYDLNDLIAAPSTGAGHIWGASDINAFGQIVGSSFLLNPLYPTVSAGSELTFSANLGSRINFEYWFTMGSEPRYCFGGFPFAQLQVKLTSKSQNRTFPLRLIPSLYFWLPAGVSDPGCQSSQRWKTAELAVPSFLTGQNAEISIRVREYGGAMEPTVHLRHFSSN